MLNSALLTTPEILEAKVLFAKLKSGSLLVNDLENKIAEFLTRHAATLEERINLKIKLRQELIRKSLVDVELLTRIFLLNDVTVEDLFVTTEEEPNKDETPFLIFFRNKVDNPDSKIWDIIWNKFKDQIKLKNILSHPCVIGVPPLFAFLLNPSFFQVSWDKFKDEITFAQSTERVQEGPAKGYSLLCVIAEKHALSDAIWEKYKDQIKLSHLTEQFDTSEGRGNYLLLAIALKNPFMIYTVLKKFKGEISLSHFLTELQGEGSSALNVLASCDDSRYILHKILQQVPGVIPDGALKAKVPSPIRESFEFSAQWDQLMLLVRARNAFFHVLEETQKKPLTDEAIHLLFVEAKKAKSAGYENAFYDVAKMLSSRNEIKYANAAYKKVREFSCHYENICEKLSLHYLAKAYDNQNKRNDYLRKALSYALSADQETRAQLVEKIVLSYITKGTDLGLDPKRLLTPKLLQALMTGKDVNWWLSKFDKLSQKIELEKEVEGLRAKLQEQEQRIVQLSTQIQTLTEENDALKQGIETPGLTFSNESSRPKRKEDLSGTVQKASKPRYQ